MSTVHKIKFNPCVSQFGYLNALLKHAGKGKSSG